MSFIPIAIGASSGAAAPQEIGNSLRLRSSNTAFLSRTPSVDGDSSRWTWSGWVKRGAITAVQAPFSFAASTTAGTELRFSATTDTIDLFRYNGTAYNWRLLTTPVYRDPSAWYHIVVRFDSNDATASNRVKLYINGSEVTAFSTATYPTTSYAEVNGNGYVHRLGRSFAASEYLDGYIADVHLIDGLALDASYFGQVDNVSGAWVPIEYSGSHGTNGYHMDFNDGTSTTTLGYDAAGSNDLTLTNISLTAGSTYDWMTDNPNNNYCVVSPIDVNVSTTSNGNLTVVVAQNSAAASRATFAVNTGKWYWEVTPTAISLNLLIGIAQVPTSISAVGWLTASGWYYNSSGGFITNSTSSGSPATYAANDVIGVALDCDNGTLEFFKNGVSQGVAFTGLSGLLSPNLNNVATVGTHTVQLNFGQQPFVHTPPSGFNTLCTNNLPTPTILDGREQFDVVTYTGNGSTQSITSLGFQPDFVWVKNRSSTANHTLFDSVRGATKYLSTNVTSGETTDAGTLTSFDSTGFSLGATAITNTNTTPYVGWCWKANGASVSNTDGTITSTVSANTAAGFSIVTYTGSGAGSATVGHGLGIKPAMAIYKLRTTTPNWIIWHKNLGNNGSNDRYLYFTTAVSAVSSALFPTGVMSSSVLPLGTDASINNINLTYVAYCFAEVPGFSSIGTYTGNGNANGPFVYCGFKPRFIMIKRMSGSTGNWVVIDTERNQYNVVNLGVLPNAASGESTGNGTVDVLANGFKWRATTNNISGAPYLYAAFADVPYKYNTST